MTRECEKQKANWKQETAVNVFKIDKNKQMMRDEMFISHCQVFTRLH